MTSLPLGKQAGPDRVPNIVYKMLPKLLAPKLTRVIQRAVSKGKLPDSFLRGDIGLIFKKGDRDEVRNYRPITLLQGAYKIFTRVLTRRMVKVVHEFVDECQKGFVPHTVIQDATMLLKLIEEYVNDDCLNRKALMVFLDMEKAFDRVSYDFLLKGLTAVGFGPTFVNTIKLMYSADNPPQRRIYANGYYSDWFGIKSGVAQGCPVSPLLFLIVAQGLRISLELEGVKGVSIGDITTFISQFADDTTLILKNSGQLEPAFTAIRKWCRATGMRENVKKREGLPLGGYRADPRFITGSRTTHPYISTIKWVQEGGWVTSLGVPIGNDLDHGRWWKKKIDAVREIANKWRGIMRRSYFGRNLVMQAMYYGRYRYWLWSMPIDRDAISKIQSDATRLLWAKDPTLDDLPKRVKRFVRHRTAIGPRSKGGMKEMVWAEHVRAVQANVIMRYLSPATATWKLILDSMLLRNKRGEELFGAGRGILMCPIGAGAKTKLLSNLPRRSVFIEDCLRAHWKRGFTQDLVEVTGLSAETLWHNPRFTVECPWQVRHYFVNVLNVVQISDVLDYETSEPFTEERWEEWILTLHREKRATNLGPREVEEKVRQIVEVVDQIPGWVIEEITEDGGTEFKDGEMVALLEPDAQEEEAEELYARMVEDEDIGTRFDTYRVDVVGLAHRTGYRSTMLQMCMHKVAWWGDKIQGPEGSTFPRDEGWRVRGRQVVLHEVTVKNTYDDFVGRMFLPPTAEEGWNKRLPGVKIPWPRPWKVNGKYSAPRDKITMSKIMRRNLFTATRDPDSDGKCLACGAQENQIHLVECEAIYRGFWRRILGLMIDLDLSVPALRQEQDAMWVTYRATDSTVVGEEQASIIDIAWRCLYAAIVRARVDKTPLNLEGAAARTVRLLVSRVTAYGRKWELWIIKQLGLKQMRLIAEKYQRSALIDQDPMGTYRVNSVLMEANSEWNSVTAVPVTQPTREGPRVQRRRPPTPEPSVRESLTAPPTEPPLDPWRDLSGDAKTTAQANGGHAECNLATTRNLFRDEELDRQFMVERQVGGTNGRDTRFPDWPRIMGELATEDDCVVKFKMESVTDPERLGHIKMAALYTTAPPHVIAIHRGMLGRVRLYDNESRERLQGTYSEPTLQQLSTRRGHVVAVTEQDSPLAEAPRATTVQVNAIRRIRRAARGMRSPGHTDSEGD